MKVVKTGSRKVFFSPHSTIILSFLDVLFYSFSFIGKYFEQFRSCRDEKQQFAIEKSINSVILGYQNDSKRIVVTG